MNKLPPDYNMFRDDCWPLCPNCVEDELWCPGQAGFFAENGRSPTLAECLRMGLSCYNCQQGFGGATRRFWRNPERDVEDEWEGIVVTYAIAYVDVHERRVVSLDVRSPMQECLQRMLATDDGVVLDASDKASCSDCGLQYEDFGLDTTLPNEQWLKIYPSYDGLLCANCIVNRGKKIPGVIAARMVFDIAEEED